ncbi:hypothetical protein AcW1_009124 [Taiwanofungus camphoratus]|nr:hypothetical protein AcV5_007147 [Antrodia cinnamomea]KAI0949538.1 hypothetical protein AcW1_009124 [Antrodia cinnamomea]KAI0958642.1 hypothetical protein AcV7_004398 [Antrodia cinnamomea]
MGYLGVNTLIVLQSVLSCVRMRYCSIVFMFQLRGFASIRLCQNSDSAKHWICCSFLVGSLLRLQGFMSFILVSSSFFNTTRLGHAFKHGRFAKFTIGLDSQLARAQGLPGINDACWECFRAYQNACCNLPWVS